MSAAKNNDEKLIEVAETLRDVIGELCKVVQLPYEQRKEWMKVLDDIIYE